MSANFSTFISAKFYPHLTAFNPTINSADLLSNKPTLLSTLISTDITTNVATF
jgi:hypothetical protein